MNIIAKLIDLTGKKFGKLTVIERTNHSAASVEWLCACDCGNATVVIGRNIKNGNTKSCGCLHIELKPNFNKIHGMLGTPEYEAWTRMKGRCYNKRNKSYKRYGGRGISICDSWRKSFTEFFKDMGKRPSADHSIDRRNNDGNYEPDNCKWSTRLEQSNNRRTNIFYNVSGEIMTLAQLSRKFDIQYATLWVRVKRGIPIAKAVIK